MAEYEKSGEESDDEAGAEQGLVLFLGRMVPPNTARELEQFIEEAGGKIEPQKLADSIKIAEDGTVSIVWEDDMLLQESNITALPSNLTVGGSLKLFACKKLKYLPEKLFVRRDLNIAHCTSLIDLPEGITVLGGLRADYCHNLRSFPITIDIDEACSLYQCYFGLNVEMFKRIHRLETSGRLSLTGIGKFVPVPFDLNMTQEAFLRHAIANDEKAAHFFLYHFSEFRDLPTAVNLGMSAAVVLGSHLATLYSVFMNNPSEEGVEVLKNYFDIGDEEPSEAILNHAELVLMKGIESTKSETIWIEEQFKESKGDKLKQAHYLDMMRRLLPRNKLILQTILSRKILQRLAARNTSNDAIAFLLP